MSGLILTTISDFVSKNCSVYTIPFSIHHLRTHILFEKILGTPTYIGCFTKDATREQVEKYHVSPRKITCNRWNDMI